MPSGGQKPEVQIMTCSMTLCPLGGNVAYTEPKIRQNRRRKSGSCLPVTAVSKKGGVEKKKEAGIEL